MFRVMELRDGRIEQSEGDERVRPPEPGVVRWIDLLEQDGAQLQVLRERFDFHPLTIEDCGHLDQRPKLEEYRDHLFLVTQGFSCGDGDACELQLQELHAFLGERYLVTVHQNKIAALESVWQRLASDPKLFERGPDFAYYLVADRLVDAHFPILDRFADELDEIEDSVLESPKREDLQRIFELKRSLVMMRKVLSPQRDVQGLLSKRGDPRIGERTAIYMRDVYDHLVRINEAIDASRDLLGNALEAYMSAVSQRTNEIVKYLTVMSAIFLPLSFLVGFFGQNFDNLPFMKDWIHSDRLMWAMIGTCVAVPTLMVAWFRKKDWL